jgi:hypothetical protein
MHGGVWECTGRYGRHDIEFDKLYDVYHYDYVYTNKHDYVYTNKHDYIHHDYADHVDIDKHLDLDDHNCAAREAGQHQAGCPQRNGNAGRPTQGH